MLQRDHAPIANWGKEHHGYSLALNESERAQPAHKII